LGRSIPADDDTFTTKTILAVGSNEFCQALFDEGDICKGLDSGSDHEVMIPPML
jgi:hypothetical protein